LQVEAAEGELTGRGASGYIIRIIEYANKVRDRMNQDPRTAAELLKAFSHPTRLAILLELVDGPKCVTDMEELLPARQANISQHLAVLRHARLVDYAQDGTLRCYYLCRPDLVTDMLDLVGRNDPVVKRSAAEIQSDKERLAKAPAKNAARPKKPGRREAAKR
jgi:ArsR family transcriptional regulator, arsenate/arsenite/antimonite-responsive transcriptional repressor